MQLLPGQKIKFKFYLRVAGLLVLILIAYWFVQKSGLREFQARASRASIQLKISPEGLKLLMFTPGYHQWIDGDLIETSAQQHPVKICRVKGFDRDFQLNIAGNVYFLFKYDTEREAIYRLFRRAGKWKLGRSSPLLFRLKINGVQLGEYLMEEKIYRQLRDPEGNYFVRLSTDTHRFRRLHYELKEGITDSLDKYFSKKRTADYFTFYSLFSPSKPLDVGILVFRYDARKKEYRPYLTLQSIIAGLKKVGQTFEPPAGLDKKKVRKLFRQNRRELTTIYRSSPYLPMISIVGKSGE